MGTLAQREVADLHFLQCRGMVLEIAAFFDRAERAGGEDDGRIEALRLACGVLGDVRGERVRRILEMLSDPTREPAATGKGLGAARGAPRAGA